jgi:hypothetical protein
LNLVFLRNNLISFIICFFIFTQAWIHSHFPRLGTFVISLSENYDHANPEHPYAAKFKPMKGGQSPNETRLALDRLELDDVVWQPYEDRRHTAPFQDCSWYSGWIMCGTAMVSPHLPERVLRQYGHVQSIPRAPFISAKAKMTRFTIDHAFQHMLVENYVTVEMRGLKATHGFEAVPGYIAWFFKVSHPKINAPIQGSPPRPANLEVLIEEDNKDSKLDVFEICQKVRTEVTDKLGGEMTLEEAKALLKKVCDDLEPITSYSVRRKRRKDSGGEGKKRKSKKRSKDGAGTSSQAS